MHRDTGSANQREKEPRHLCHRLKKPFSSRRSMESPRPARRACGKVSQETPIRASSRTRTDTRRGQTGLGVLASECCLNRFYLWLGIHPHIIHQWPTPHSPASALETIPQLDHTPSGDQHGLRGPRCRMLSPRQARNPRVLTSTKGFRSTRRDSHLRPRVGSGAQVTNRTQLLQLPRTLGCV